MGQIRPLGVGLGRGSVAKFDLWDGLNIYRSRGKWYVYHRATGDALLRGFVGDRADLKRKLKSPEFIATYNRPRLRARPAKTLPIETLGGFVHWFTQN
jgi:hypothetical protein